MFWPHVAVALLGPTSVTYMGTVKAACEQGRAETSATMSRVSAVQETIGEGSGGFKLP